MSRLLGVPHDVETNRRTSSDEKRGKAPLVRREGGPQAKKHNEPDRNKKQSGVRKGGAGNCASVDGGAGVWKGYVDVTCLLVHGDVTLTPRKGGDALKEQSIGMTKKKAGQVKAKVRKGQKLKQGEMSMERKTAGDPWLGVLVVGN